MLTLNALAVFEGSFCAHMLCSVPKNRIKTKENQATEQERT